MQKTHKSTMTTVDLLPDALPRRIEFPTLSVSVSTVTQVPPMAAPANGPFRLSLQHHDSATNKATAASLQREADLQIAPSGSATPAPSSGRRDRLIGATQAPRSAIFVVFADGQAGMVDLASLGLNAHKLRLSTVHASPEGGAAEIEDITGHTIHIDASILRARIDPAFAQELRQAIGAL